MPLKAQDGVEKTEDNECPRLLAVQRFRHIVKCRCFQKRIKMDDATDTYSGLIFPARKKLTGEPFFPRPTGINGY